VKGVLSLWGGWWHVVWNNWEHFAGMLGGLQFTFPEGAIFISYVDQKVIDIASYPSFLLEMWVGAFWTCLQNVFQLFETTCHRFFRKESALFATKTRSSNEFSQHCWQASILRWWFLCWPIKIWRLCCRGYVFLGSTLVMYTIRQLYVISIAFFAILFSLLVNLVGNTWVINGTFSCAI